MNTAQILRSASARQPEFPAQSRNAWCDCIRGYAILLVCAAHVFYIEPVHARFAEVTAYFKGDTGVFMFYVLSGFLVTGILARESCDNPALGGRAKAIGNFFMRRMLRLQPSYLLFLVLYAAFCARQDALSWWVLLLPLSNWFAGPYITWHIKTLHVEETYYLLMGTCCACIARVLPPLLLCLLVAAPLGRVALFVAGKLGFGDAFFLLDVYPPVEPFAVGGLLSLKLERVRGWNGVAAMLSHPAAVFAAAMLVLLGSAALRPVKPFSYPLLFFWPLLASGCSAAMIVSGLRAGRFAFSTEWLRRVGVASYTLYLFQQLVLGPWDEIYSAPFSGAAWLIVLVAVAALVPAWYACVEKPLTEAGARWFPRVAQRQPAPPEREAPIHALGTPAEASSA